MGDLAKEKARSAYKEKSDMISQLINPLPECHYHVDVGFLDLEYAIERYHKSYGSFEENPDFQRGHVWSVEQQIKYIESFVRGVVSDVGRTITLNCPDFQRDKSNDSDLSGFVVIDGLQRLTAVRKFMKKEFTIFNDIIDGGVYYDYFDKSKFSFQVLKSLKFAVMNFQHKSELLNYYITINSGGVVHSKEEIDRVKKMLEDIKG